jgi:hypothetical protein
VVLIDLTRSLADLDSGGLDHCGICGGSLRNYGLGGGDLNDNGLDNRWDAPVVNGFFYSDF